MKSRTETSVQCHACKLCFHEVCSGLPNPEFAIVSKKSALRWFCRLCDSQVTDLLSNFEKFKKMNAELRNIKDEIDRKLNDFETRISSCEKAETSENITSTIKKVVQEVVQDPSNDMKIEAELIEKKRRNLIFFKIPESNSDDIETRIKQDYEFLTQLFGRPNIIPKDIVNIFRVGKKSDRPRPLIVKFQDLNIKEKYCKLAFGKNLKLRTNNESVEVAVTHDKTKKQREESRRRYEQHRARNSDETESNRNDEENFQEIRGAPKPSWATVLRTMI